MQDSEQASEREAAPKATTILFAEDDPFVRELISTKLRSYRYCVTEAASGDDALQLLQGGGIEVMLTDICMPGALDGWGLAKQARLIHPQIAVIYASSRPADATRQVSGSIHLRKPYRLDAIIAALRQVVVAA